MIDLRTRQYFGIKHLGEYSSDTTRLFEDTIHDSILDDDMVALVAPYGSGKTHLWKRVKARLAHERGHQLHFIEVYDDSDSSNGRGVHMGSIRTALALDLCDGRDESPRRSAEALSRQVVRLLGANYVAGRKTCLIIEDAHRLHPSTLSALKLLRERDFNGHAPLLSIVLLGWPALDAMLEKRRDILTRLTRLHLDERDGWMVFEERRDYLFQVFGELIEPATAERIATLHQVPVEINAAIAEGLRQARLAGYDRLDGRVFQPTLREQYEALKTQGVSLSDIREAAGGIPNTSSVHDAINHERGPHVDAVREGMNALSRRPPVKKAV